MPEETVPCVRSDGEPGATVAARGGIVVFEALGLTDGETRIYAQLVRQGPCRTDRLPALTGLRCLGWAGLTDSTVRPRYAPSAPSRHRPYWALSARKPKHRLPDFLLRHP